MNLAVDSERVDEAHLERGLARVRATAADPVAGIFGPQSLTWRVDREAILFLGAGRALLLQLAHPWVAAAVSQHSVVAIDPIGRFRRTFEITYTAVFGTVDQALGVARRLHRRHAAVEGVLQEDIGPYRAGSRYRANDVATLRWVHATLVETALLVHDLILPPLTEEERERYYAESRLYAALFGIPGDALPPTWQAFAAYAEAMRDSEALAVGPAARAFGGQLLAGAKPWLRPPRWYRALTAGMLPARLREAYGLRYEAADRRAAERAVTLLRRCYRALPGPIRHVGPYHEAMARLRGREPNLATQCLNRLWIGRPRLQG
jgi:uncharacterized protein (DUF2236 family)